MPWRTESLHIRKGVYCRKFETILTWSYSSSSFGISFVLILWRKGISPASLRLINISILIKKIQSGLILNANRDRMMGHHFFEFLFIFLSNKENNFTYLPLGAVRFFQSNKLAVDSHLLLCSGACIVQAFEGSWNTYSEFTS